MKMYMIRYDQNMFLYFKEPNLGKVTRIDETGWFADKANQL